MIDNEGLDVFLICARMKLLICKYLKFLATITTTCNGEMFL